MWQLTGWGSEGNLSVVGSKGACYDWRGLRFVCTVFYMRRTYCMLYFCLFGHGDLETQTGYFPFVFNVNLFPKKGGWPRSTTLAQMVTIIACCLGLIEIGHFFLCPCQGYPISMNPFWDFGVLTVIFSFVNNASWSSRNIGHDRWSSVRTPNCHRPVHLTVINPLFSDPCRIVFEGFSFWCNIKRCFVYQPTMYDISQEDGKIQLFLQ